MKTSLWKCLLMALAFATSQAAADPPTAPVLGVGDGGSGSKTAAGARANLGAAASGVNGDITALHGLTEPLTGAQGGTGATTPSDARANLGAAGSGVNSDITKLLGLTTPLTFKDGGPAYYHVGLYGGVCNGNSSNGAADTADSGW